MDGPLLRGGPRRRIFHIKQILMILSVVALVGCGKKDDGNTGVVNSNKPSPKAASEKLITDPIVEKAIRKRLEERFEEPTGQLTKTDLAKVTAIDLSPILGFGGGIEVITTAGLNELVKLKQLVELDLHNTQITDADLKDVAKLQQLEILSLWNTKKITDAGLRDVAKLEQLRVFSLSETQITDEGLKEVAKLQQLERLNLHDTKITAAGVAELQKALPECLILSNPTK